MVICKYFLQGTCRFGDNCKFEHQINTDHGYTNASSVLLQNQPAKPATNVDTNTLVKAVVNDMMSAEKGGQWLLSSYAPFKEKPAFPGFEDHSMEEMRYLFYEAVKSGTVEQYKQNLQMMLQQAVMKIRALQNPSPDAVNMLKNIYNTPPSSSFNNNQAPFESGGGAATTNPIFGGSQPTQTSPVFRGGNTGPSIFGGGNPNTQQQQNVFAGANNSVFLGGAQAANKSIFGAPAPVQTNQSKSIFVGNQPAPNSSSIFGPPPNTTQQSIFGNPPPFGGNPPTQPNIFQQNQQPNQYAAVPPNQFVGAPPNASVPYGSNQYRVPQNVNFNVPQNASPFTDPQTILRVPTVPATGGNRPAFQHSQNIFGNPNLQPTSNVFGGDPQQPRPNEEFYSKLEDLTEEEIRWFQSGDLDISKIPEKPPTYEMCFKM